ncbi:MAG: hypothetical protein EOP84_11450 [Verrucomicrobiaceae bacterium]|nr:MAG: hypothetical protein EOP84_11450 [Verrucomicrobiaceae bacterium]
MNSHSCCQKPITQKRLRSLPSLQRFRHAAKWLLPGAIFMAMPKCPVCVATYVALVTGVSISLPTAAHLRFWMLTLCLTALAVLAARRFCPRTLGR